MTQNIELTQSPLRPVRLLDIGIIAMTNKTQPASPDKPTDSRSVRLNQAISEIRQMRHRLWEVEREIEALIEPKESSENV